jgi:hypothetical protein
MVPRRKWLWMGLGVLLLPSLSLAATWRVERDGSADFSMIQPAIDAAAAGDTILIGPGRFPEFEDVTCPGWTYPVGVWVNKDDLTIIGAGSEQTIIGKP